MTDLPSLPADLWALSVSYLPIHTIMPVVMGNRFFQNEVLRLLPVLCIDRPSDLDIPTARKCLDLKSVTEVYICCLVREQGDPVNKKYWYNVDVANRIVPFVSQFPNLKIAYLGGTDVILRDAHEIYHGLLWALCGAYSSRALPQGLQLRGLEWAGFQCILRRDGPHERQPECPFCSSMLSSFPLERILCNQHNLLCTNEKETVHSLEERLQGQNQLDRHKMWMKLLTNTTYFCDDNDEFAIDYAETTLKTMKALVEIGIFPETSDTGIFDFIREISLNHYVTRRALRMYQEIGLNINEDETRIFDVPLDRDGNETWY